MDTPSTAQQRFTNAPTVLRALGATPYFDVSMDTWYWSEWEPNGKVARLGTLRLGEGPLTMARGVSAFVVQHAQAFCTCFAGVLRPSVLYVVFTPKLTGIRSGLKKLGVPATDDEALAVLAAIDHTTDWLPEREGLPYEGITCWRMTFDLLATVRDEAGAFQERWLPEAGEVCYYARYSGGPVSARGGTAVHRLTPLGKDGRADWTVSVECNVLSLFRRTNTRMLQRVRGYWRTQLQTDSQLTEREHADTGTLDVTGQPDALEAYFLTLAEPPAGTPADNRALYERNWPRLQAAVQRWERWIERPFHWML
jgi:hypothetical protein